MDTNRAPVLIGHGLLVAEGEDAGMAVIEIDVSDRIKRHLAAVRMMAYMAFPDSAELRTAAELTFRTKLADWYSDAFAQQDRNLQAQVVLGAAQKLGEELTRVLAEPSHWVRNRLFDEFLKPFGGAIPGTVALTDSPSASTLQEEWTRRWFGVVYTGKLACLIGSIHQHHPQIGASLNKAIYILSRTEGDAGRAAGFRRLGFPAVYESSLKDAWRRFKPVAHLCAAYVTTETHYYEDELARDFMDYWGKAPALYDDDTFRIFCLVAGSVESFVTSFRPRGQQTALIPKTQIYSLPENIFDCPRDRSLSFRELTDEERAALGAYRAPKQFV
jgi:hypothetical protein